MKNRNLKNSDNWKTPPEIYAKLDNEFNFNFDPCPYSETIPVFDGLKVDWKERNYINPPYSKKLKEDFVKKGIAEYRKGKLCVFLLPVSTSTKLFHGIICPEKPEIRFIRGRIAFHGYNTMGEWSTKERGMHDSMVLVFDGRTNRDDVNVKFASKLTGILRVNNVRIVYR